MSAQNISETERLTLANGLNVVLCHEPRLRRCAASLRVAAGSHDVSAEWPGLAHFLEHLFFLGTDRFGADQNLMRFLQRHGGVVNASTRERTTDFFFEVPARAFGEGVERLCDMLARPCMDVAEQLREREVLHAEFIAWNRDAETRHQSMLLAALNPMHPLRGFHAGNRYSLAVQNPAFQKALNAFYQRFYQAGQITLCLAGPQSLSELRALATRHGAVFASGQKVAQAAPAQLVNGNQGADAPDGPQRLHLTFACEELPARADRAAAFLCYWLNTSKPGGLADVLARKGLASALKAVVLYQFERQLLLDIDVQLTGPAQGAAAASLLFSWLAFFKTQWPSLLDEYSAVQQRRLQSCSALELAHHYCGDELHTFGAEDAETLNALLARLTPEKLLHSLPVHSEPDVSERWQLPAPNPFLQAPPQTGFQSSQLKTNAMIFRQKGAEPTTDAAIYLRWALTAPQPDLWAIFNQRLRAAIDDARQAGVELSTTAYGNYWQLKMHGVHQPMAAIVQHAIRLLGELETDQVRAAPVGCEPPLIPIRQLIKVLPDRFLLSEAGQSTASSDFSLQHSRWTTFAVGLPQTSESAVRDALTTAPGRPQSDFVSSPVCSPGKLWKQEATPSSEDAVLLFCPTPGVSIADEAAWRMLAHVLQGPFYQRLRVELQLGYAVFSGLRQIGGRTGLVFGVQSPACEAADLLAHIGAFIGTLPDLIRTTNLSEQRTTLAAQFAPSDLPIEQLAELLWQAHQAGHDEKWLGMLLNALNGLDEQTLVKAAHSLACGEGGWLVLSNRAGSLPER